MLFLGDGGLKGCGLVLFRAKLLDVRQRRPLRTLGFLSYWWLYLAVLCARNVPDARRSWKQYSPSLPIGNESCSKLPIRYSVLRTRLGDS